MWGDAPLEEEEGEEQEDDEHMLSMSCEMLCFCVELGLFGHWATSTHVDITPLEEEQGENKEKRGQMPITHATPRRQVCVVAGMVAGAMADTVAGYVAAIWEVL